MDLFASLGSQRARRAATLAMIAVLLAAAPLLAQPRRDDGAANGGLSIVERAEWSLTRPSPLVTVNVRMVMGYLVLVPAVTLFLLYLFRPRPYVMAWVVSWLASSGMAFSLSFSGQDVAVGVPADTLTQMAAGRTSVLAWSVTALVFGFAHQASAQWFRAPFVMPRWTWWVAGSAIVWLALSTWSSHPGAAFAPAFILMSLWQAKGAIVYIQKARLHRFSGALFTGTGLLAIALGNGAAAVLAATTGGITPTATTLAYLNVAWVGLIVLGMHLLVFEDVIADLRSANVELSRGRDEMKAMAVTDPLTRCNNRRFLDEISRHELQHHLRYNLSLSLLYIDIDHFKAINDSRGHLTGDLVLQTLGAILRARTRQADYVFRWGGDEFLVLLSADETQAQAKAEEIRQAFLASPIVKELPDGVDLSIGVVAVPPDTENFEPLIDQADREMYRRKRELAS